MATVDALAALQDALDEIESEATFLEDVDAELTEDLESVESRARVAAYLDTIRTDDAIETLTVHDVTGSSADLTLTVADDFQPEPTLDVAVTHVVDQEELHDSAGDDADVIVEDSDEDLCDDRAMDSALDEDESAANELTNETEADDVDDSPSEDEADDESGFWCGRCGEQTDTENGVKIHNGHNHDGDAIVLEEEPSEDDLVGDVDDEAEEVETEDVDDDEDDDPDPDGDLTTDDVQGDTQESTEDSEDTDEDDEDDDVEDVEASVSWIDGAEDSPDDTAEAGAPNGDVDDEESPSTYPRECSCGFEAENALKWHVHRTEDHESPQSRLDYLEPGEFAELIEDADSVGELANVVDWSTSRVLTLLGIFELADEVASSGGNLGHVTDVEFDGFVDEVDDGPSPLATDDSPHKYDTGDSAVTNPDTDGEDDGDEPDVDAEDLEPCVLDDYDVDRHPDVDDDYIRRAARRVEGFGELADEIRVPNKSIARVAAMRLDIHAEVERSPTDADTDQGVGA